jgi:hypothetical protein
MVLEMADEFETDFLEQPEPQEELAASGKPLGRPKGSKTRSIPVDVIAARCPACGSSSKGHLIGSPRHEFISGELNGVVYTSITYRRYKCKCGQLRVERTYNRA